MKRHTLTMIAATLLAALPHGLRATPEKDSLAPHFELQGVEPGVDVFPLKSTSVRASIAGVIAEVEVTQTYANTGQKPLEAVYVFPGSTRAAVQGMEIKIGDRTIKAQIAEKEQAKRTYETAKTEKKVASLLEQHRPNVFQMSVANIAAGSEVQVKLRYSEMLVPTERVYEFHLPGVVGPRYSSKGSAAETWISNPFLSQGTATPATLDFALHLQAGMPIKSLTSPSHDMDIKFASASSANISLRHKEGDDASNRDVVVRYQLTDRSVQTGLLLHEDKTENFFLLNVQPPERVTMEDVPSRDYLFVVDVSGSMEGFPLDTAKQLMTNLLDELTDKDTFNLLLFAGGNSVMSQVPLSASRKNIAFACTMLDKERGGGGTELRPALERAFAMPGGEGRARSIVVITDGFVDAERGMFEVVQRNLNKANVFAFGIGASVNRHLIEGLASVGGGEPFVVTTPGESAATAKRFRKYVSQPVLTDIKVRTEGFDAYSMEPAAVPDLFADRPLQIVGKWRGEAKGRIIITGRTAKGPYEASFDVASEMMKARGNPALRPLWARERVRVLSDYAKLGANAEDLRELTNLGLTYSLLTERTSFVAVDERVQTFASAAQTVHQPLPLPQGVSNSAIAGQPVIAATNTGSAGSVPEPGVSSLLLLGLTLLLMHRRR